MCSFASNKYTVAGFLLFTYHLQMGYGSQALKLLLRYYEGHIPSLSENEMEVGIDKISELEKVSTVFVCHSPLCTVFVCHSPLCTVFYC